MDVRSARKSGAVIGVLGGTSYGELPGLEPPFVQGLKEAGFIVDKDIGIEWRWAERHCDRLPSLVSELLGRNVSVIAASMPPRLLQQGGNQNYLALRVTAHIRCGERSLH
jgi:hypothetical protein